MADTLFSPSIQSLRQKAARGEPLTIEEVAAFVTLSRKSFLAADTKSAAARDAKKSPRKGKTTPADSGPKPQDVDFF